MQAVRCMQAGRQAVPPSLLTSLVDHGQFQALGSLVLLKSEMEPPGAGAEQSPELRGLQEKEISATIY